MRLNTMSALTGLLLSSVSTIADPHGEVISLHGSGTTNPSKCYWQIMDQFEEQSKAAIRMTYRAVGSSTGQLEFLGKTAEEPVPFNDFGSGDIPISTASYNNITQAGHSVIHFPVLLGAISFFHSVPTGSEQLDLDACTLAKIFKRDITEWNDPAVRALNLNINFASGSKITVAHRILGSSSTASITQYLHKACPAVWTEDLVGKEIVWPDETVGCQGSSGMTACIRGKEGTIGYIDSGHGHSEGLQEIKLKNAADTYLSSKEAIANNGILAAFENAEIPTTLDGDFGNVTLLNAGGKNTWPIVAMSYVYVRQDITFLDTGSRGLLKAFLTALYDEKYIKQCEDEFGFVRVTGTTRDKAIAAIDALIFDDVADTEAVPTFTFEAEDDTQKISGQEEFVISQKRRSFADVEQEGLVSSINSLNDQVSILEARNIALLNSIESMENKIQQLEANDAAQDNKGDAMTTAQVREIIDDEQAFGDTEETQLTAALVLSSLGFCFWMLAFIVLIAKFGCGMC